MEQQTPQEQRAFYLKLYDKLISRIQDHKTHLNKKMIDWNDDDKCEFIQILIVDDEVIMPKPVTVRVEQVLPQSKDPEGAAYMREYRANRKMQEAAKDREEQIESKVQKALQSNKVRCVTCLKEVAIVNPTRNIKTKRKGSEVITLTSLCPLCNGPCSRYVGKVLHDER